MVGNELTKTHQLSAESVAVSLLAHFLCREVIEFSIDLPDVFADGGVAADGYTATVR